MIHRLRSKFSKLGFLRILLPGPRSVPMLPPPGQQEAVNGLKFILRFSCWTGSSLTRIGSFWSKIIFPSSQSCGSSVVWKWGIGASHTEVLCFLGDSVLASVAKLNFFPFPDHGVESEWGDVLGNCTVGMGTVGGRGGRTRGGRENDKVRQVSDHRGMPLKRQAPMLHPRGTLCPILLCHWWLPGSIYKWGASFSFFSFFFFFLRRWRLLVALNLSENQTSYNCVLLGAMEIGKEGQIGSVWIYHHLRGKYKCPSSSLYCPLQMWPIVHSPLNLRVQFIVIFSLFLLFEDYLHLCHGKKHDWGYINRMD